MKIKTFPPKLSYQETLRDPRWQKRRLKILERDDWKCVECGAGDKTLHVHHSYYDDAADGPWDYPLASLMTLCEECHSNEERDLEWNRHYFLKLLSYHGFNKAVLVHRLLFALIEPLVKDGIGDHLNPPSFTPEEIKMLVKVIHDWVTKNRHPKDSA